MIAFGARRYDVVGWCTYPGMLCTWNLGREEVNATRPDTRIDTDTCLMSCAFHPAHPVSGTALFPGRKGNGQRPTCLASVLRLFAALLEHR